LLLLFAAAIIVLASPRHALAQRLEPHVVRLNETQQYQIDDCSLIKTWLSQKRSEQKAALDELQRQVEGKQAELKQATDSAKIEDLQSQLKALENRKADVDRAYTDAAVKAKSWTQYCDGSGGAEPDWTELDRLRGGQNALGFSLSSVLGSDVGAGLPEKAIEGITMYLVERAQREVVRALVIAIRAALCDKTKALPRTCRLLSLENTDVLSTLGASLRAAVQSDLADLVVRELNTATGKDACAVVLGIRTATELLFLMKDGQGILGAFAGLDSAAATCLKEAPPDPIAVTLFRGARLTRLLTASAGVLDVTDPTVLARVVKRVNDDFPNIAPFDGRFVTDFAARLTQLITSAKALSQQQAGSSTQQYVAYLTAIVHTFDALVANAGTADVAKIRGVAQAALDLVVGVLEADYGRAFVSSIELLGASGLSLPPGVAKYGPLLADIASAKSAEDIKKAIETSAEPTGSFAKKRGAGNASFGLTAYFGGTAGGEWVDGVEKAHVGLSVPIGLEASVGIAEFASLGLFVSVVDVGTLVDFRLNDDSNKSSPAFTAQQVVSPGIFATFGCCTKVVPLAVGVGASVVPDLRENETSKETFAAFRVGAFLGIDMPIFLF